MAIMKIALAIWNDRIAPVFDVANTVLLVSVQDGSVEAQETASLPGISVEARLRWLVASGVTTLVCGAISRPAFMLADACDLTVIPFISGTSHDVIDAFLEGRLDDSRYAMPGCHGMKGRCGCMKGSFGQEDGMMAGRMDFGGGGGGSGRGGGEGCGCDAAGRGRGRSGMAAPGSTRTALEIQLRELEAQLAALREQMNTQAT